MGFLDNLTEIATDLAQSGAAALQASGKTQHRHVQAPGGDGPENIQSGWQEGSIKKAYASWAFSTTPSTGTPRGRLRRPACERITVSRELIQANNDRVAD